MKKLCIFIFIISLITIVSFIAVNNIKITNKTTSDPSELYKNCGGNSFEGLCKDEKCIKNGIERRVFDLWKQRFMAINRMDEKFFNDHILISDVTYEERSWKERVAHWWDVRYIYKSDWVLSRQNDAIDLASTTKFTGIDNLDDETITRLLNSEIRSSDKIYDAVIPYQELQKLISKHNLKLDFCRIDLDVYRTGKLLIHGFRQRFSKIPFIQNACEDQTVNLITGEVEKHATPCVVD